MFRDKREKKRAKKTGVVKKMNTVIDGMAPVSNQGIMRTSDVFQDLQFQIMIQPDNSLKQELETAVIELGGDAVGTATRDDAYVIAKDTSWNRVII